MKKLNEMSPLIAIGVILTALIVMSLTSKADEKIQVLSYTKHVKPIFQKNCSACHNAHSGLPNWLDYDTVYEKRAIIKEKVIDNQTMPPQSANGFGLNLHERSVLKMWLDQGAKK